MLSLYQYHHIVIPYMLFAIVLYLLNLVNHNIYATNHIIGKLIRIVTDLRKHRTCLNIGCHTYIPITIFLLLYNILNIEIKKDIQIHII